MRKYDIFKYAINKKYVVIKLRIRKKIIKHDIFKYAISKKHDITITFMTS